MGFVWYLYFVVMFKWFGVLRILFVLFVGGVYLLG